MISNVRVKNLEDSYVVISWDKQEGAQSYRVYWADKDIPTMKYKCLAETKEVEFKLNKSTHVPHFFKVAAVVNGEEQGISEVLSTKVKKVFHEQREKLSRGLIAVKTKTGVFLSWRLMIDEVKSYSETGLTGTDFVVYKNGIKLALVTDSTNFLDEGGTEEDAYQVAAFTEGKENEKSGKVKCFTSKDNYIDIPMQIPVGGITPSGEKYEYHVNDMSVGDVDGDGEYEYIVKWDPTNSHDVSIKGYTGKCYVDCYKLDGTLLWRLDMGVNIRSGAHYTQFMVYDFNNDGKAEMAVKTAPGTKMTVYNKDGSVKTEAYITMPEDDVKNGYSHTDNYVCSAKDYYEHIVLMFMEWHVHSEVISGHWPATLEECFGIEKQYEYPLSREDAKKLADYFIQVYAKERSPKNELDQFEGFIYEGPEYLTMFGGDGEELETIRFKYGREDDGLMWGDYAMNRIEPCNRVDRFLSGVAYLDGERPYLIICRGYYTRTTIVAYEFFEGRFKEYFSIDSGFVPMSNPFSDNPHMEGGTDATYGILAGQGNHSLSTADVDGDGFQEIIYGAAVIDHDGSVLYSSHGYLPDGTYAKLGHGDALHVANIDPDRPGLEIFNVFEGAMFAPYGFALRDAETGEVLFGEYAETDLGRCMIGDINPKERGLQVWVYDVRSCDGRILEDKLLGTNQSIRWAADMTTQVLDGADLFGKHSGVINDNIHGNMLIPENMATNNGTKGNPCLIADVFGDFREELLLRKADNSAIRIYTNTDITNHKLFTLMHDIQYRTGVAWQNNCYNQPGYTKFYYASDMEWEYVLPQLIKQEETK
ncbi:rhamnogalacturonan lyase [Konateibacter massiliensis]|uniref:rhamnogalacturonan lyase n=1 Tax=Konateibacter massiliensis TaxID=2002841 RepID=UPI0015D4D07D|nr:rhamnogalacturonan lyase [Konateibacter massiliensis]